MIVTPITRLQRCCFFQCLTAVYHKHIMTEVTHPRTLFTQRQRLYYKRIKYEIQILKNQKPSNTVPRMTVLLFASIRAKLPIVDFEPRFYCRTNYHHTPRLTPLTGTNAAARYKRISSDARNKRRNAFRRQKTRHRTIKNPPDKGRIISVS